MLSFVDINRGGINLLENGKFLQAASTFAQGLQLVQTALRSVPKDANLAAGVSSCTACCSFLSSKAVNHESTMQPRRPIASSFSSFHQTPLNVEPSLCRCGCLACNAKLAFVFIFNLALVYHSQFLTFTLVNGKNTQYLSRALRLYQLANHLYGQRGLISPLSLEEYAALRRNVSHATEILNYLKWCNSVVSLLATVSGSTNAAAAAASSSSTNNNLNEQNERDAWNGFVSVLLNLCAFDDDQPSSLAPAA